MQIGLILLHVLKRLTLIILLTFVSPVVVTVRADSCKAHLARPNVRIFPCKKFWALQVSDVQANAGGRLGGEGGAV